MWPGTDGGDDTDWLAMAGICLPLHIVIVSRTEVTQSHPEVISAVYLRQLPCIEHKTNYHQDNTNDHHHIK